MTANLTSAPRGSEAKTPVSGTGWLRTRGYHARAGLSTPIITVLDRNGKSNRR